MGGQTKGAFMFIGHYGPAFGAKAALRKVPLWVLFIAVQFMDVVWSILVMAGIEKLRIVPGFTQGSPLDLYFMPYTHGLFGAIALSILFGCVVAAIMRTNKLAVFWICAAAVFSHWILDYLVHVPDLWIYGDVKIGLGLWHWLWISLPLEIASLIIGALLYARYVPAKPRGDFWLWLFVALMAGIQLYNSFSPPTGTPQEMAQSALIAYAVLAALAGLVDFSRAKPAQSASAQAG